MGDLKQGFGNIVKLAYAVKNIFVSIIIIRNLIKIENKLKLTLYFFFDPCLKYSSLCFFKPRALTSFALNSTEAKWVNSTPTRPGHDTHGHEYVRFFFTVNFNHIQENVSYHVDTLEL
jgi:hypothetical protein